MTTNDYDYKLTMMDYKWLQLQIVKLDYKPQMTTNWLWWTTNDYNYIIDYDGLQMTITT